jgi:Carboxyl transferase domain
VLTSLHVACSVPCAVIYIHSKQLQDGSSSSAARSELLSQMKDREKRLSGVYQQLSVQFADLHDTPGRMAATGAVQKVHIVIHLFMHPFIHSFIHTYSRTLQCTILHQQVQQCIG